MKYFYVNKNYIIYFSILFFIFVNLTNIYYYTFYTFREGWKPKKKFKSISKTVNKIGDKVSDTTKQLAEQAKRQAEQAAEEAKRQAEEAAKKAAEEAQKLAKELDMKNALEKLTQPIINLEKTINNTLGFFKDF